MRYRLFALGTLLASGTAFAHHSIDATYYTDQKQTIEGDVVQVIYRNPHTFIHLRVNDERWAIEGESGKKLGRQGVTRETIKLGDRLIVTGFPGRNPDHRRLWMVSVTRPADGWTWTDVRLSKKKIRGAI